MAVVFLVNPRTSEFINFIKQKKSTEKKGDKLIHTHTRKGEYGIYRIYGILEPKSGTQGVISFVINR